MGVVIMGGIAAALLMLRQEAIGTHLKIAELHARTFGDHLTQTIQSIDLASKNIDMFSKDGVNIESIEKSFEDMLRHTPYIRSVSMLESNGKVVASTNKENIGKVVTLNNFIPKPFLSNELLRFGSPQKGRDIYESSEIAMNSGIKSDEISFVPIIKSVNNQDKEYTLLIALNSDYFINRYMQSLSPNIGLVDIIRIDGTLLFSTDENLMVGKLRQTFAGLFSSGEESFSNTIECDGKNSLVAYQLSPAYPVGVVARLDYETTLEHWERQRLNVLLITALLVIISASLGLALLIRHKKQQMMEAQILKSKITAMGELIGMIAHQWRQPLTVVSAILSNLSAAYEDGELDEEYLRKSVKDGNEMLRYMSKTIDNFRNFFKPQSLKEEFCLCGIVLDAVELTLVGLQTDGIKIFFNSILVDEDNRGLCEKQMPIVGYKNEFLQAIISIIKNSKEAMQIHNVENKIIYIDLKETEDSYIASISDNGGGVDKKVANRIFEPYFTTKHGSMGAGMGLYVAKMLIENDMDGKLGYKNIDDGASFAIELKKGDNASKEEQ